MNKELSEIKGKITYNLKLILELQNNIRSVQIEKEDLMQDFFINIIEIIDAFENKISNLSEKYSNDEDKLKLINSFEIIRKKIHNILSRYGVTQIEFPNNKLIIGFSKAVGTEPNSSKENDTILSIVKNGYNRGSKIIREAELIVVKN